MSASCFLLQGSLQRSHHLISRRSKILRSMVQTISKEISLVSGMSESMFFFGMVIPVNAVKESLKNVHHIESRQTGGNAPNNLITLCETCHKGYHKGQVKLPKKIKRGMTFKDAAFMGIMRWAFYDRLKEIYLPLGIDVSLTYGYLTKNTRIAHQLPKTHYLDARCISGHPDAISDGIYYHQKKIRCHNRQLQTL